MKQTVIINPNLSIRDRAKIINPLMLLEKTVKIISIAPNDQEYSNKDLVGLTGKFVPHELYKSVFILDAPIEYRIGNSVKEIRDFFFSGGVFEILETNEQAG